MGDSSAAATGTGTTGSLPVAVHKPVVPIMGGIAQTEHNKYVAWTGGTPNKAWKGLETATPDFKSPNQLRSSNDVKGYNHRKTGLTTKFKKTDMLIPLKKSVWTHLKDTGMDSIAFLPDMRGNMSNIIHDHAKFTLDSTRVSSARQLKLYDKYDITNDDAATAFLLDSLEDEKQ